MKAPFLFVLLCSVMGCQSPQMNGKAYPVDRELRAATVGADRFHHFTRSTEDRIYIVRDSKAPIEHQQCWERASQSLTNQGFCVTNSEHATMELRIDLRVTHHSRPSMEMGSYPGPALRTQRVMVMTPSTSAYGYDSLSNLADSIAARQAEQNRYQELREAHLIREIHVCEIRAELYSFKTNAGLKEPDQIVWRGNARLSAYRYEPMTAFNCAAGFLFAGFPGESGKTYTRDIELFQ